MNTDHVQRFVFEGLPVRGELVHLDAAWRAISDRQDYPEPVRQLLGETMVATLLLSSTLKYKGSLIIQLTGEGPVTMLVMECTSERTMRGLAHWAGDVTRGSLQAITGNGKLIITIDSSEGMKRYQSIVALEGGSITEVLENYLSQSEQIDTRLWIATNSEIAAGMLLQKLPGGCNDSDIWDRAVHIGETVEEDELLSLSTLDLLHRLYHEEDIRLFDAEPVSFRCKCSRERVRSMLRALGSEEVNDILSKEGKVAVRCEFCNQYFEFDRVDATLLFVSELNPDLPPTKH